MNSSHRQSFATTRWSMVVSAGDVVSAESERALAELCEIYWPPLYAYARRRVADRHEAQDLTQAFFAKLLEKNYVESADPTRGRFRAFLLTAFKNFMSKQWEKRKAIKRGGQVRTFSFDFAAVDSETLYDPGGGLTPEQLYDQHWALTLLDHIMQQLEQEFKEAGKSDLFAELKSQLIGDHEGTTYAEAGERLGISETAAKKAGSRLRKRYRELLREEISHTVDSPAEIDDEIHKLFAALES